MKMHQRKAVKFLCTWFLLACAFGVHAASFDCAKASTDVETMICNDAQTSALDSKLQQTYATALKATDAYGKKALAKEQRNWLKYARGICQDTACLRKVYADRIAVLARNEKVIVDDSPNDCIKSNDTSIYSNDDCLNLIIYRDPNARIDSFNHSLAYQKISGRIIGCTRLIDEPVGNPNSNESFGGYCVFQGGMQRKIVAICNASMTAKFRMRQVTLGDMSDKSLADFIDTHCYGGP